MMPKMMKPLSLAFLGALIALPAAAQQANVVTACGSMAPFGPLVAGGQTFPTVDVNGNLCLSGGGGGGSGGGGGITSITAGTTPTTGFTAGQLMMSDGTKTQALGNNVSARLGDPAGAGLYFGAASSGAGPAPTIWFSSISSPPSFGGIGFHIAGPYGSGISVSSGGYLGANNTDAWSGTIPDAALTGGVGTGIAAIRNVKTPTSASALRVYNTFTDGSNGEWGALDWQTTPNVLTIGTQANGTGTARQVSFASAPAAPAFWIVPGSSTTFFNGNVSVNNFGQSFGGAAPWGFVYSDSFISGLGQTATTITGSGGTCATSTKVGGSSAGTVVLSGVCASTNTIAFTGMRAAPNGYACDAEDRTTRTAGPFIQSASTTTGFTLTVGSTSSVAADVLQWKCIGY